MAVVIKTNGVILVGEFTTHFRLPVLVGDWDVHCRYGSLTHGLVKRCPFENRWVLLVTGMNPM